MSELTRFRRLALVLVAGGILVAGGLPFRPDPVNRAHWSDGGLRFEEASQVVSESSLWLERGEFTLELWLTPDEPPGAGNREILSFVDGSGVRPLLLGQWPKGFLLRSRVHNPEGLPTRDRYGQHPLAQARHLAIVGRGEEAMLFVAGEPTQVTVAMPEVPLGGRLLLGSSATGWPSWRGEIQAVALYDRAIGAAEIKVHAAAEPLGEALGIASEPGLVAFYPFDQKSGRRIESRPSGAPALWLPERVSTPSQPVLRFAFSAQQPWFQRDLAINLLGFLPLGLIVAWQRGRSGVLLGLGAGLALSLVVELGQVFIPGRSSSAIDLVSNTLGAGLGAGLALWGASRLRP